MTDPSKHAHFQFLTGSKAGQVFKLTGDSYRIGRQPEADVRYLPSEAIVSGDHATVSYKNGGYVLRDEGSRNGTLVDGHLITEHELKPGEVIEFGEGGPRAKFLEGKGDAITPTIDAFPKIKTADLYREAKDRAQDLHKTTGQHRVFSTTREFVTLAYHRTSRRARYTTIALATLTMVGFAIVLMWQVQDRRALQAALGTIAEELASVRGSRLALERDLSDVQSRNDSLLNEVEESRLEQAEAEAAGTTGFVESVNRTYGAGVALIVSSFGYVETNGKRFLRYQLNRSGEPDMQFSRSGGTVPRVDFGGNGPPVTEQSSATGFLIDSAGWLVTNRHVAAPWENDDGLERLRARGLDVEPRFIELRAYFPPGTESYRLQVIKVSDEADVAILGTGQRVNAPPLVLASDYPVPPGEQIVFMGYPTGVHNLLFRIPREERLAILREFGERPIPLAEELARRSLIQPLVIGGTVADTTGTEIIHTAGTTGGGSGGPIIGHGQQVVGIHYAAVRSPIEGDPFQTQRGVRVEYAWKVLPNALRLRLINPAPDSTR
jgi:S1-C subfamily serine protease